MEIPRVARPPGPTQRLPEDTVKPKRFLWPIVGLLFLIVTSRFEGGPSSSWGNIAVVAAAVLVVGVLLVWVGRKEGDKLFDVAAARGFRREPAETLQRPERATMPLPYTPGVRRFSRVVRSRIGDTDVWVFTVENSRSESSVIAGVVAFDLGREVLPAFEIRPKGIMETGKRIEFPDDPEFAARCHVTGDDGAAVRRQISPEARRVLKQIDEPWWVHGRGRWLVTYRQNRYLKFATMAKYDWRAFDPILDTAARIFTALTGR